MFIILQIVRKITGKIGVFFIEQHKTLADVNGYVEEMVGGQKVIKVFCHEEKAKEVLRKKTVRGQRAPRAQEDIMVFDHGHIIERGTHEQLIDRKGIYYQLYTGAFELE